MPFLPGDWCMLVFVITVLLYRFIFGCPDEDPEPAPCPIYIERIMMIAEFQRRQAEARYYADLDSSDPSSDEADIWSGEDRPIENLEPVRRHVNQTRRFCGGRYRSQRLTQKAVRRIEPYRHFRKPFSERYIIEHWLSRIQPNKAKAYCAGYGLDDDPLRLSFLRMSKHTIDPEYQTFSYHFKPGLRDPWAAIHKDPSSWKSDRHLSSWKADSVYEGDDENF